MKKSSKSSKDEIGFMKSAMIWIEEMEIRQHQRICSGNGVIKDNKDGTMTYKPKKPPY